MTRCGFALTMAAVTFFASAAAAQDLLHLPIGDPARKTRDVPIALDIVTDSTTGSSLTPGELAAKLADVKIVFVGESHTDAEFHRAQRILIEQLHKAGRQVLIGLEMYPYTEQPHLDGWSAGSVAEDAFLAGSRWYANWGYHWNYYRDIFMFARDNKLRMFAVNTPREVVSAVRKKGLQNLTPAEAAHIPSRVDTDNAEHLQLFKAYLGGGGGMHGGGVSDQQWQQMFAAQCTWGATMGYNAVQAFKKHGSDRAVMVVLIGSGHVSYGLGIQRQAALWFDGKMASVIPVPVADASQPTTARASYADYLWGVAREAAPQFPALGLSVRETPGEPMTVIDVQRDSVGAGAGVKNGDRLLALDGVALDGRETMNRLVAAKRWSDSSMLRVRRADEELALTVHFRRKQ